MPQTKHTPGPWKYYNHEPHQVTGTLKGVGIAGPGHEIGVAYGWSKDEAIANAKLIAAAPEMLEALEDFLILQGTGTDMGAFAERVKGLINKATE